MTDVPNLPTSSLSDRSQSMGPSEQQPTRLVEPFSDGLFETLSAVILNPMACFEAVAVGQTVPIKGFLSALTLFVLITVSMIGADIIWKDRSIFDLGGAIPFGVLGALFGAVYLSSILSAASHCFTGQTRFRQTLTVIFLAAVPWLLYAPVAFLKSGLGFVGNVLGLLLGMCLWAWSVVLFALGVKAVYRLTLERTLIFLTLPLSMTLVFSLWIGDLFTRMGQILP